MIGTTLAVTRTPNRLGAHSCVQGLSTVMPIAVKMDRLRSRRNSNLRLGGYPLRTMRVSRDASGHHSACLTQNAPGDSVHRILVLVVQSHRIHGDTSVTATPVLIAN